MELTEIYQKGEAEIRTRDIGWLLDGVETEFVLSNNRSVLDQYTIRQRCIDGVEAETAGSVLGVDLATPIIMSSMTMPIPAIVDDGLMKVADGLKQAGSLMWTGTPIPKDLKTIKETGVVLAANVKPLKDRPTMFKAIDEIQAAGVNWLGIEIDSGQGTKVHDRQMAFDCSPLSLEELKEIRKMVSIPLIFKGVLSREDAEKSVEAGADGIFVSNHGAHTLDYLPHPFQVMEEIVSVVKEETVILVDGGFRRGSDALKGLAFGAALVGLGRPILYGLAANGSEGVRDVVKQMTEELKRLMSMTGAASPGRLGRDALLG
ncbi:MAG: alpha-hydroxy-acid oxidizing protein [Deltaproteobacteria bacterium]|nr:alpha-hydroxy-acid oxidizing protein [Deltaproteobacteria bacterium]MBW2048798.1 alpha-hydroxy-acid oxidizing protein [Deltaproteobacteria bacterium]MBW2110734.1 alpha-hydroxy-acid oxidizing protein [Deltaproteobacteria bacterium]MBW2352212.1 alpha-hydroxy-acid oxidizing protein [Deltaproteobacteria bacterium]